MNIILTAVYGRPEVTKIFAENLQRFLSIDYRSVCVLSMDDPQYDENVRILTRYDIDLISYPNNPLGEKLNSSISYILDNYQFDYLMNLDSDDLIHSRLLTLYKEVLDQKLPFFGLDKVYFYNLETKELRLSIENQWCAGRMIRADLLRRMGGKLYFDQDNRGLDQRSVDKVNQRTGIKYKLVKTEGFPYIIDIKTFQNLNDWNFINSYSDPADFEIIKSNYPKSILRML